MEHQSSSMKYITFFEEKKEDGDKWLLKSKETEFAKTIINNGILDNGTNWKLFLTNLSTLKQYPYKQELMVKHYKMFTT